MKITSLCLKRPVTTLMFFLGIIMLGVISWYFLPQELFPPLVYPQITVLTRYQKASPHEIESLITRPIEETVGTVNRVKRVSSISREGTSIVMIEFDWGTNMDFASLEVREKLDLIKEKLPRECDEPIVMKYNPFELPMIRINLTGESDPLKLRNIAKKDIKEELEKIEGVGSVEIVGGLEREISIELDEAKLRSAYLSILDVSSSLEKANLNYPAGTIKEPFFEFLIRTVGEFTTVKEIENLPVKAEFPIPEEKLYYFKEYYKEKEEEEGIYLPESERLIFIKDIGKVVDGTKERESISRYQGKECVTLLVRKQSQTNTVKLSQRIKKELEKIRRKLSPNLNLRIVYDESEFIKESLGNVRGAAIQGGVLAFLVILLFLRNLWFSLGVIVSIPICILIVLLLVYLSKMSLNLISLGGLALGVGMLVDNAIVVLESIFVNPSQDTKERTINGTREVGGAIFGSTLTTICVFLPMIFVIGIAGQLFRQLAFSVVFSLLASFLVALTILPLSIYFYLKKRPKSFLQKEFKISWWGRLFDIIFKYRLLLLGVVAGLFFFSLFIFLNLERELFPKTDQHEFIIKVDAPPGTPLEKTDNIVKNIEEILFAIPQVKEVTINIGSSQEEAEEKVIQSQGPHQAQIFVKLDRKSSTSFIIKKLEERLKFIQEKGISLTLLAQESFLKEAFVQQAPLILEIKGQDLEEIRKIGSKLEVELEKLPFLYNVKLDYPPPRPEVKVEIIKDKAFLYNISTQLVAATVNTSLKGAISTKFKEKGEEYDIKVILRKKDRENIEKLKRLLIHGLFQDREITIPLMEVAKIKRDLGPLEIKRREKERTLLLTASIYRTSLSKVIERVNTILNNISLSSGYRVEISGEAENMKESFSSLRFALILAIILVFMVMASEFESLWQPFLILFTLPLSLIGVSLILLVTGSALNVISFLGLIMLGGIIVNNGIVLVDYINFLRREKKIPLKEALKLASLRRIRPIFMTSLTTILGLLPLSLGKGTSLMQPLGIVTMGGLISAMFLTPVVLPILYYYFETLLHIKTRREIKEEPGRETKIVRLSPRQRELLKYLKENGKITRVEYAKLFDISIPTAARDLKSLLSLKLIEARGPLGPGRYYILKKSQIDIENNKEQVESSK
jgi:HAE1 family hydrophobic/amphiphilic exporter-1